jgi:hypothetical protein
VAALVIGRFAVSRADDRQLYIDILIASARARGLAQAETWHALLHYRAEPWHVSFASLADSGDFFLAPNGATDAQAELDATLRSFFAPADATARGGEHPQCVFVARYRWLRSQLDFDPERLPEQPCPKFEAWRAAIDPVSVTLVFPEAYLNNPSSMFGHTLLRFDAEEGGARRDLLAYAANFAADPGDDSALAFTVRGIFGHYPGFFNVQPYYEKVVEYADWEQRDLWEYELDLSTAEIAVLLAHLWELRGVGFDYFFFDENCSYQLLELLRVARPELVYWRRFHLWVAPSDTVRVVVRDAGLLRRVSFRPSATTALRHEAALLSAPARRLALDISEGRAAPTDARLAALTPEEQALVLTVAYDALRHTFLSRDSERTAVASRARSILLELSRIPNTEHVMPPVPTPSLRPDQGHGSARAALGAGWRRNRPFAELALRPAYHDLLDPQGGYTPGAQIDFLNLALRIYGDDGAVRLHGLTIVDVLSLAPRDALFQPLSWRAGTRVISLLMSGSGNSGIPGLKERYAWRLDGGAGLAYEVLGSVLTYGFLSATSDVSGSLHDSISAGPGADLGAYFSFAQDRWRSHLFAQVTEFVAGEQHTFARWGLGQRLRIGASTALRFEVGATRDYDRTWVEGTLAWQWFF